MALASVTVNQIRDSDLYCVAEVPHVISPIMYQPFLERKYFFEESGDVLQEFFQISQVEHVFKAIDFHLVLLAEAAPHDVEEVSGVFELGELAFQELDLADHLLCLTFSFALGNFPQLSSKAVAELSTDADSLLADQRFEQQVDVGTDSAFSFPEHFSHFAVQQFPLVGEGPASLLHSFLQIDQKDRVKVDQSRDVACLLILTDGPKHFLFLKPELGSDCDWVCLQEVIQLQQHIQPHRYLFFAFSLHEAASKIFFP